MRHFICTSAQATKPFLIVLEEHKYNQLLVELGLCAIHDSERGMQLAIAHAFGEYCEYAELSANEFWQALRASQGHESDGGTTIVQSPKPTPRRPRGGLGKRFEASLQATGVSA
jgi:hypothetical protein